MKINEAIKEIKDYFNLDVKGKDEQKLKSILSNTAQEIVIVKEKKVYAPQEKEVMLLNIEDECRRIAEMYGTTVEAVRSKNRSRRNVSARAHLCRYIRKNSNITLKEIATYLHRDHTSVMHLLYSTKQYCSMEPLYKRIKL